MTTNDAAAQVGPRRLCRPHEGRMVAGVAAGLGRYTDVDPVIYRVVLAVLTLFGGAGLLLYGLGWLLMPEQGDEHSWLDQRLAERERSGRTRGRDWLVIALVAVAVLAATSAVWHGLFGAAVLVAVVAAVIAAVTRPAVSDGPRLGLLTASVAALAAGGLVAADAAGALHPSPADVLAVMLGVIGLGLVGSAWWGTARGLVPLGLLVALGLGVASVVPSGLSLTAGQRTWTPVSATDLRSTYRLGVGDATLDLRGVAPAGPRTVRVRVGAGHVTVRVPEGEHVRVRAHAGVGNVTVFGHREEGVGASRTEGPVGTDLSLDVEVGAGEVVVVRG